ncbi:MAG: ABC transporter permease [Chloroflexi bacterium]|nr:MAG: ABC transporter permease [Chloroflexota bacterium]RLT47630.1 MAG: ABC transporter permease [Chloroflexota bacterium]RLT54435.1 MAG: ABC transporter permease [Chloroflexota bacterium]
MAATAEALPVLETEAMPVEQSQLRLILRRFARHRLAVVSSAVLVFIFLLAGAVRSLVPYDATEIEVGNSFAAPFTVSPKDGRTHYLGTDHLGRDYWSRILYAARISLTIAVVSVIGATAVGALVGALSGYFGGALDDILMRFVEFLLTIPTLPILLILSSILLQSPKAVPVPDFIINGLSGFMYISALEARQVVMIMLVLMSLGWLGIARLTRGVVLSLKTMNFVEAARASGVSTTRIILRHMIPNAFAPLVVSASLGLADYVISEAALSFLGFGIQDPTPTWGNMLSFTESYMFEHPWLPLIPGLPIFICALAFNYVGDGLRDALDPRLQL